VGDNLKAVKLAYQALDAIVDLRNLENDMSMTQAERNVTLKIHKDINQLASWYENKLTRDEWRELKRQFKRS
jgi:hypothetical protein